ncbi:MAG: ATP-binding cassette domain-containing protein [Acidobacteria bacterium]|nr:ATP-binding cassette domain-containing protein [Acidobacteriota bacterium]
MSKSAAVSNDRTGRKYSPITTPAIEFRDVSIAFDDRVLLDRINFIVPSGGMKIIVGPSNCGKTTIIKLAIGLLKPDSGQIFLEGQEITSLTEDELLVLRSKVGVVMQSDALFSMSVAENIAYRLPQQGWSDEEIEPEIRRVLHVVGLDQAYDLMPEELSGGMSRRTAVARALAGSPKFMFYDSPCSGLDPIISRRMTREVIRQRDIDCVSSLYVTQNLDEVRYLCSHLYEKSTNGRPILRREDSGFCMTNTRVMMISDGHIIFDGQDETFWNSLDEKIQRFLT